MELKQELISYLGCLENQKQEMMAQSKILSKLPINNIKFHQLQIIKNTQMALDFKNDPSMFNLFTLEEYIEFIVKFSEKLNPAFIIERFTGEVPPRFLAGPNWGLIRNDQVNLLIEKKFKELNTWQGKNFT